MPKGGGRGRTSTFEGARADFMDSLVPQFYESHDKTGFYNTVADKLLEKFGYHLTNAGPSPDLSTYAESEYSQEHDRRLKFKSFIRAVSF